MKRLNQEISFLIVCTYLCLFPLPWLHGFAGEPQRISPVELKILMDDASAHVVVDVRSKRAYDDAHIPTSLSIPFAQIQARQADFPKDGLIVLYWSWPAEATSVRAAQLLINKFGFAHERLMVLEGGLAAWVRAGYSLVSTLPARSKGVRFIQWGRIKSGTLAVKHEVLSWPFGRTQWRLFGLLLKPSNLCTMQVAY